MASSALGTSSLKRKDTPNRRWTKDMDDVLIPCLAEQAKAGLKVDKSFKRQAFVEAAKVVNNKIHGSNMDADNIENRLRTLKTKYQELKKIMGLSGIGWNDRTHMLVLKDEAYRTYIESFPKAKDLLNKPIPHYDDLRIICGNDHATGDFAISIFDQFGSDEPNIEGNNEPVTDEFETEPLEQGNQQQEPERPTSSVSTARAGRTSRVNSENQIMDQFGAKFDRLSASLEASNSIESSKPKPWKLMLTNALWSMEGYHDDDLEMVFEILKGNKKLAEGFYLRSHLYAKNGLITSLRHKEVPSSECLNAILENIAIVFVFG